MASRDSKDGKGKSRGMYPAPPVRSRTPPRDADESSESSSDPMETNSYGGPADYTPTEATSSGKVKRLRSKGMPGGTALHKRM